MWLSNRNTMAVSEWLKQVLLPRILPYLLDKLLSRPLQTPRDSMPPADSYTGTVNADYAPNSRSMHMVLEMNDKPRVMESEVALSVDQGDRTKNLNGVPSCYFGERVASHWGDYYIGFFSGQYRRPRVVIQA